MKHLIALGVLGLTLPAMAAGDEKTTLAKLEGRWRATSIVGGGQKVDLGKGVPSMLVVKGDKATFFADEKVIPTFQNLTLRPDPAKAKAIDIIRGRNELLPCLYELSGDELKIAMPMIPDPRKPGDVIPRPESFDTKDKPVLLFTMKRVKD